MTQPQFQQFQQPQYTAPPAQQFQQPQYTAPPAQQFQQPQYTAPPQVQYQQPQYGAPQPFAAPQQFPGQQFPQPQAPAQPLVKGTLDDFYSQPNIGEGVGLKFPQVGTTHIGVVARPLTDADVQQNTEMNTGAPAFYRDGRPKLTLLVPLVVQPTAEMPDGKAVWFCGGAARTELGRAMAEAGAPAGPPEAGATISITLSGKRPTRGGSPANVWTIRYARPQGAAPVPPQAPAQQTPPDVQPVEQVPVMSTATGQPVIHQQPLPQFPAQQAPQMQAPVQPAQQMQAVPQAPAPAQPPVAVQPAPGLDPAQQELFQQLLAQQQGQG